MDRAHQVLGLLLLAGAAYVAHKAQAGTGAQASSTQLLNFLGINTTRRLGGFDPGGFAVTAPSNAGQPWTPPPAAAPYMNWIHQATAKYNLPPLLLARQLQEESGYRPDVIDGTVTSSAGAVGIAQLIPRYFPNVNPRDPQQSIFAAAQYMHQLYGDFGSWKLALAAYNWGPGNVKAHGMNGAPAETQRYVAQISADVPAIA